jgi:hypothetical protein
MKLDDIKVGQEIYEVNVLWTSRKVPCVKNITHYTIISLPDMKERNTDKTVFVLEEGSVEPVEKNLHSKNVFPNNYNLDRWFKTQAEANAYAKRIHEKELSYTERTIVEESNVSPIRSTSKISIASRFISALSFG